MSVIGDGLVQEFKSLMELLIMLLKLIYQAAQHKYEKDLARIKSGNLTLGQKIGAGIIAFGASKIEKMKMGSGEIDLKKFSKLTAKGHQFSSVDIATKAMPEILDMCKKAKIPVFCCDKGGSITSAACPTNQLEALNKIVQMAVSKTLEQNPQAYTFVKNDFKSDIQKNILRGLLASEDVPSITFTAKDGGEVAAVPTEYAEKYKDILSEAKEMVSDLSNIEITDFEAVYPWDDIGTMAIEVTPHQAKMIEEYYKSEAKIVDIGDGKLYAFGDKSMKEPIGKLIESDVISANAAKAWSCEVIDNSITLNKSLVEHETDTEYVLKIPRTNDYIKLDKTELEEIDNGKTLKGQLEYGRDYTICDAAGNEKGTKTGSDLAENFNTRSPFYSMMNDSTDRTRYNSKSLDRIELFNTAENKLVSLPIRNRSDLMQDIINLGIEAAVAQKVINNIAEKMPDDYKERFGFKEEIPDYKKSRDTINKVKQTLFSQKTANAVCKNDGKDSVGKEQFAIYDKIQKNYVLIDKDCKKEEFESALKDMGYFPIERAAVISMVAQQYNMEGELIQSQNMAESIVTNNPDLSGVNFSDIGNDHTAIFNAVECGDGMKLKYVVVDKTTDTLEFEQACKDKLGIHDAASVAEMAQIFKSKMAEPTVLAAGKEARIDGQQFVVSQITSKFIEVKSDTNDKSVLINKDNISSEKMAKTLGIAPETAEKLKSNVEKSFKSKENAPKNVTPINKLKSTAEKIFQHNRERTVDEMGRTQKEALSTTERSR